MRRRWPWGLLTISLISVSSVALGQAASSGEAMPVLSGELAASGPDRVLSFKEWKSKKISEAINSIVDIRRRAATRSQSDREAVDRTESKSGVTSQGKGLSPEIKAQLSQAKINLDVVRDLSPPDYIALYLAGLEKESFAIAVRKFEENELVELLWAYNKKLREGGGEDLPSVSEFGLGHNTKASNP